MRRFRIMKRNRLEHYRVDELHQEGFLWWKHNVWRPAMIPYDTGVDTLYEEAEFEKFSEAEDYILSHVPMATITSSTGHDDKEELVREYEF